MAMKPSLQATLGQQLRLTPQLRQAIHLLQLSAAELEQEVAAAVESNPLLDWDDTPPPPAPDGPAGPADDAAGRDPPADWDAAADAWSGRRPGAGDDDGARDPPAPGATALDPVPDAAEVQAVLRRLQHFDPPGVGARDLGECLRLQLDGLPEDTPGRALAIRIAADALAELPKAGVDGLARTLDQSREEV